MEEQRDREVVHKQQVQDRVQDQSRLRKYASTPSVTQKPRGRKIRCARPTLAQRTDRHRPKGRRETRRTREGRQHPEKQNDEQEDLAARPAPRRTGQGAQRQRPARGSRNEVVRGQKRTIGAEF